MTIQAFELTLKIETPIEIPQDRVESDDWYSGPEMFNSYLAGHS